MLLNTTFYADPVNEVLKLDDAQTTLTLTWPEGNHKVILVSVLAPSRTDGVSPMRIDIDTLKRDWFNIEGAITYSDAYFLLDGVYANVHNKKVPVFLSRHPEFVSYMARHHAQVTINKMLGVPEPDEDEEE